MGIVNCDIVEPIKIWDEDLVNLYDSEFGTGCKIGCFVEIGGSILCRNVSIGAFTFIPPGVYIEDDVWIGPRVTFMNDKYPPSAKPFIPIKTSVLRGASIGAGCLILPGVTIGKRSTIGAGSLVTENVPKNAWVAGSPARRIG